MQAPACGLLLYLCLSCAVLPLALGQDASTDATNAVVDPTAKSGEALEDAVGANSEAQEYKEEAIAVKAQVVKQEAAAELSAGDGDIDTTGAGPCFFQPIASCTCS